MKEPLFDLSDHYNEMLSRGLAVSGETKEFFLTGRLNALQCNLGNFTPKRILDFGCGIGESTKELGKRFPSAQIIGLDTSEGSIAYAREYSPAPNVDYKLMDNLGQTEIGEFDLCYVNGVFHHIESEQRYEVLSYISRHLAPNGHLAFFENNPWNPGAHLVMSRIEFDRNANMLSISTARELISKCQLIEQRVMTLFYFPRILGALRPFEKLLSRLPFGAQYFILASKVNG
jgi:trans-aconitate methyltransferase